MNSVCKVIVKYIVEDGVRVCIILYIHFSRYFHHPPKPYGAHRYAFFFWQQGEKVVGNRFHFISFPCVCIYTAKEEQNNANRKPIMKISSKR